MCPLDPQRLQIPGAVRLCGLGLAGIGNVLCWRRLEEGALEAFYGERYRAYRLRTWF